MATLDDVDEQTAIRYAARDADATLRVYDVLNRLIDVPAADGGTLRRVYEMDLAIVPMVERMVSTGMLVDVGHFTALDGHLTALMAIEARAVAKVAGRDINPNSPDQVAELLFVDLKLKGTGKKTPTGKLSTQDKVLEAMRNAHPVVPHIIDYREYATYRDDFCLKMVRLLGPDGRIHPNLKLTRVSSGRLSCFEPNLLGIPTRTEMGKLLRAGFVPAPGRVYGAWDLNQIEMREMAHQSEDPVLIKRFLSGEDVHRATAADMFGKNIHNVTESERYAAKRVGFGVITGITEKGLAEQMALAGAEGWDEQRCAGAIQGYFEIYKRVRAYMEDCRIEARRYGFVRDRWGRVRNLPGVHSELKWVRAEAERQSHSFKISASAQGVLKKAMAGIWQWLLSTPGVDPLLQIHDELLFEIDDKKELIDETDMAVTYFMCNSDHLRVPIKADGGTGPDWSAV